MRTTNWIILPGVKIRNSWNHHLGYEVMKAFKAIVWVGKFGVEDFVWWILFAEGNVCVFFGEIFVVKLLDLAPISGM